MGKTRGGLRKGVNRLKYIKIPEILFSGKRNLPWNEVEKYISKYTGTSITVVETGDIIQIGSHFASEYCGSLYTRKLHGTLEKAKANASLVITELLKNATNRRWVENKDEKHSNDAKGGWYRYDVFFSIPVNFAGEISWNNYRGTIVARINDNGIYIHDLINIKKEDS